MTVRNGLDSALVNLLSRHCRGPAACRKAWRLAEDLRALGLDVTPQAVLDAAADLGRQGFPVVATAADLPAVYLEEARPGRARADWRARQQPRRAGRAVPRRPVDRALAHADAAYRRRVNATSSEQSQEACHAPA